MLLGIIGGAAVLLCLLLCFVVSWCRRKKRKQEAKGPGTGEWDLSKGGPVPNALRTEPSSGNPTLGDSSNGTQGQWSLKVSRPLASRSSQPSE